MSVDTEFAPIAGERVLLRAMTAEDQPEFCAWLAGNAELRRLIDDPRVPTMEDQLRWFQRSKQQDRMLLSIVAIPGGELIGNGGFVDIDQTKRTAQFRITIGNTAFLGKGYGAEASALMLGHAFTAMNLSSVWLRVRRDNVRAVALYRKLGFNEEGEEPGGILRMRTYEPPH